MRPGDLKPEQFKAYPPQGRQLTIAHIDLLRRLPLSFLPILLRELIAYDWKFPAERRELDEQIAYLGSLSPEQFQRVLNGFASLSLSAGLEHLDKVNAPSQFVEQLTAYLWSTHQVDAFRSAAKDYADHWHAAMPQPASPARLGIVVLGQGISENSYSLFRKLRPQGVYFRRVNPENGLKMIIEAVVARAAAHPIPYGHWYIDGGQQAASGSGVTCVSYAALEHVRGALLRKMHKAIQSGDAGPEGLRTTLAEILPEEIGFDAMTDRVLARFQVSVLTEGSGTQIFSTTFAQWAAREALRRAQPSTLLLRFAPRQRQQTMNELLSGIHANAGTDPVGSLVDADIGGYYTWLNQQRLSGADRSSFLVWFEDHGEAVAIGPMMPAGTESSSPCDLKQLLTWLV